MGTVSILVKLGIDGLPWDDLPTAQGLLGDRAYDAHWATTR